MKRIPIAFMLFAAAGILMACSQEPSGPANLPEETRSVTLAVPGMSCATCPIRVETALNRADGVVSAQASLDDKQARVTYDPARIDMAGLIEAIAEAGFTAREEEA